MSRAIEKEAVVAAPASRVWDAFTTAEGCKTFFAPDARVELSPGGRYELLFDLDMPAGSQGGEGCTVVSFDAPRRLTFTWNAPPQFPTARGQHTEVTVVLEALGEQETRVRLRHDGFFDGAEWEAVHAYFVRAWDLVLDWLKHRFSVGPIDWSAPPRP
jgi:uncharacterized protein YndB with AHSA1/START domain